MAREGLRLGNGTSDEFEDLFVQVSVSETGAVTLTALGDQEAILQERSDRTFTIIRPSSLQGSAITENRFVDATDSGQLVIGSVYRDSEGLTTGIFDIVDDTRLVVRAVRGERAPGPSSQTSNSDGLFEEVETDFQLNASRSIAFFATVDDQINFGDGVFYQESNSEPLQAVVRQNQLLTGGALGNRQANFVGSRSGFNPDTTFLLADDATVYVSGPITISNETTSRVALIRWTPDDDAEVLLVGDETLPDASPVITLDEITLQDVSANGAVAFKALGSNNFNYPYHFHPETGLTLLANLDDSIPSGTITSPVFIGPQLDDNGDAIFSLLIGTGSSTQQVLSLFDVAITPEGGTSPLTLPTPCVTVTANSSTVTISEVPNDLSLQLQILDETNNQFVNFGSSVDSANFTATLPGPDPTTVPGALIRIAVAE